MTYQNAKILLLQADGLVKSPNLTVFAKAPLNRFSKLPRPLLAKTSFYYVVKTDGLVKSQKREVFVIPAEAGI